MKGKMMARVLAVGLSAGIMLTGVPASTVSATDPAVTEIPNTDRTEKDYDTSFLSVTGFAQGNVNDRTEFLNTEKHRVVSTEEEFLKAVDAAKTGAVKIIEITEDLDLGWDSLSEEAQSCSSIHQYGWDLQVDLTNPSIMMSNVSQLEISNTNGLTIFSQSGVTVRHAEWKLQGSSSDIVIRNIKFDGMWHWSDAASSKEAGWTPMKINGAKGVWLDHCTFTLGADGLVDAENGAAGVTYSWCVCSLPTDENPDTADDLYKTVMYMEYLYQSGQAPTDGRYYQMREAGASVEAILAYEAYHGKAFLVGSGDKDYKDDEKTGDLNGNQRLRITFAYDKINNIGSRFPRMRQGVGHIYNCYVNNMEHMQLHKSVSALGSYGGHGLNRNMIVYNGGTIAADTTVFYGVDSPLLGDEYGNPAVYFSTAYNRALIVNSKVTKTNGKEYTGSSWDNNGVNEFTSSYNWHDKSTIGTDTWAWYSSIVGVEDMERNVLPTEPFEITYDYETGLPYSYQTFPLDDVTSVVDANAGAYTYSESPEFWVRTEYDAQESFEPVDTSVEVPVEEVVVNDETYMISMGDVGQVMSEVKPSNATNKDLTYASSDPTVAEVWDSGLVVPKKPGTVTITATAANGQSATCSVTVYQKVSGLSLESRSKTVYTGTDLKLGYTITPEDATNKEVVWSSSNTSVATVDEDGTIHPLMAGRTTITCKSVENADIKATCTLTVKEGTAPTEEPTDEPEPTEEPTDEPGPTEGPTDDPVWRKAGDVDGNGVVDAADALAVLKHAAQIESITDEESFTAGDLDGNGQLEAADALIILKIAAQLI